MQQWIDELKTGETKIKRIESAIEMMKESKSRTGKNKELTRLYFSYQVVGVVNHFL
jgi:hypothetical protein